MAIEQTWQNDDHKTYYGTTETNITGPVITPIIGTTDATKAAPTKDSNGFTFRGLLNPAPSLSASDYWEIKDNGVTIAKIYDQIATLENPLWIPYRVREQSRLSVDYVRGTAGVVSISAAALLGLGERGPTTGGR